MAIGKVLTANTTEYGNLISQNALAYEVRMTSKKPEEQWRKNHVIMAIANSVEEAIAMCKEHHPDDPIVDQVVLRNRGMDLILSRESISC